MLFYQWSTIMKSNVLFQAKTERNRNKDDNSNLNRLYNAPFAKQ